MHYFSNLTDIYKKISESITYRLFDFQFSTYVKRDGFSQGETEAQKMRFETELFSSESRTSFELADLVDMLNSTGLKIIDTNHQ
jgi:hypothetical protein